jgi:hypothetical protein
MAIRHAGPAPVPAYRCNPLQERTPFIANGLCIKDGNGNLINNRQNGRRRGRGGGGGQRQNGGGGQGQRDSGNRIDSRARGNAAQLLEKYRNMARDAQMSGDRVNTEYYLQFADHYFRVLADQRGRSDEQMPRRLRDDFDSFDGGFDGADDFGDEGDQVRADEQLRGSEGEGRGSRDRDDARQPRNREDGRQSRDRDENRQSRDRDENRQSRDRDENRQSRDRDEGRQPRDRDENRQPRDREDGYQPREREERRPRVEARRDAAPAFQPAAEPANDLANVPPAAVTDAEEAPRRRRGRKPREEQVAEAGAPDAAADMALGIDRLPPALGVQAAAPAVDDEAGEEAPKPRRRRVRTAAAEAPQVG